jgi:hypothetical protein
MTGLINGYLLIPNSKSKRNASEVISAKYDFTTKKPWLQLTSDAKALTLSEEICKNTAILN